MSRLRPIAISVIVIGLVVGIGYGAVSSLYLAPRTERVERIEALEDDLDRCRSLLDRRRSNEQRLDEFVSRTLGPDVETVDHRLRTRLNRLLEECGIREIVVGTGRAKSMGTPASRAYGGRSSLVRELKQEVDFVVVTASVNGEGSLEQVLTVIDRIGVEPWISRIDAIGFDPKDNGTVIGFSIQLSTLYVPGEEAAEPPSPPYDPARRARFASLVATNPFRLPPAERPPAPVEPPAPEPTPAPPAFPYGQWVVTGIASVGPEVEVWMHRRGTDERTVLRVEGMLGEATLLRVEGDSVVFGHGDRRWRARLGEALEEDA